MMTLYEAQAYVQDYEKTRLHEAETDQLLRQAEPRQHSQMKLRLPKFIAKWTQPKTAAQQLQECPEIV